MRDSTEQYMVNPYGNQLEQQVLCAEPLELVAILHRGLLDRIRDARHQLAENNIPGRARSISLALAILGELGSTLDLHRGGQIALGLHRLYSFLTDRLLDGNYRQADQPLADAEAVTATLLEAWTAVSLSTATEAAIPAYSGGAGFVEAASLSVCG